MLGPCMFCDREIYPDKDAGDSGSGDVHMVCLDEWFRRQDENMCVFCGDELDESESMSHPRCHTYDKYPSH